MCNEQCLLTEGVGLYDATTVVFSVSLQYWDVNTHSCLFRSHHGSLHTTVGALTCSNNNATGVPADVRYPIHVSQPSAERHALILSCILRVCADRVRAIDALKVEQE